jgi:RND family efflux transporter MFP subunit
MTPYPVSTGPAARGPCHALAAAALAALVGAAPARAADFDCVLEPRQVVDLRAPVSGLVERIAVERGDFVRAGQPVVFLDSGQERAALDVARHKAGMKGALRSGESRLEFASGKHTRREELAREEFISAQEREESVTELRLADAELEEARDNRRLAELEVRRNEEAIRLRVLRSPIAGVVTERNLHAGELAEPADGKKPILRIADIATLHAEAVLPADAYTAIKPGMKALVSAERPLKFSVEGVVKVVDRVLDAASGTFGVRLEVPNARLALPAGIHCRVEFPNLPATAARPRSAQRSPL